MRATSNQCGVALIAAVLVLAALFVVGTAVLVISETGFRSARAQADTVAALHVANAGIHHVVARQNDLGATPRYLFHPASYQSGGADPFFVDLPLVDPETGQGAGRATRRVVGGKDPRVDPPPYTVESTGTWRGAVRVVRQAVAPLSLLEYAVWSEDSITMAANLRISGKTYSASSITLSGPPILFQAGVEYVVSIVNRGFGTFEAGLTRLPSPHPRLTALVDLARFETAAKQAGGCGDGIGLYIGPDAGARHNDLFQRAPGVYQVDLSLFDLSGPTSSPRRAVLYNGTALRRFDDGRPLEDFNGILFVDGELHLWGINGGRSREDATVLDRTKPAGVAWYPGPAGAGNNRYSNNRLDPGEDGANGGRIDGTLDPAGLGMSLTVVSRAGSDVVIDHNVFMGVAPDGRPVRMAVISGDAILVDPAAPKALVVQAALLALGEDGGLSWSPLGSAATHQDNYWARGPWGGHVHDLDGDGQIETDNGQGQPGDRNEGDMLAAWTLLQAGNLVTARRPVSGVWASDGHTRIYAYDPLLVVAEPPCYPVLPLYGVVAGTWEELR